jgi:4a-hydroxytetrahydrobiopterin dehydratase
MTDFLHKKCVPCEGGVDPLPRAKAEEYLQVVPEWQISDDVKHISRDIAFKDFVSSVAFIDELAKLAESEGHHPDVHLTGWNHVRIELWTHSIGGLSENDFIVAAKANQILSSKPELLA